MLGVSITEALKLMSDDTHDDMINLDDPSDYEDPVSQRAMAFCHVAKLADTVQNEAVKELCLTMLRKLNASIEHPRRRTSGPLKGGKSRCLARPRADRRDLRLPAPPCARLTFRFRVKPRH